MNNTPAKQFSITVTASPYKNDQVRRALRFAHAIERSAYPLLQIFFYGDGVLCASPNQPIREQWEALAQQAKCPLYVCVSAAERRQIDALTPPWQLVGLGDWIHGLGADRHLHFGGS
jgi:sulfur relay protein TusD/DsrE